MSLYQALEQGIAAAESDMAEVTAHAAAITNAIRKAQPWLNGETYAGAAADQWFGDWQYTYSQILTLLNSTLPASEQAVIAQVTAKTDAEVAKLQKEQAPASNSTPK